MPVIIVHGVDTVQVQGDQQLNDIKKRRAKLIEDNIELVNLLEKHGGKARPFMSSGHVLSAQDPEIDDPGYVVNFVDFVVLRLLFKC